MTDLNDLLDCRTGRANYAKIKLPGSDVFSFVYAYMANDGCPLLLVGFSLEDVRIRRDIELEQTFRRVPRVGSVIETEVGGDKRTKPAPVPASECCEKACNRAAEAADPVLGAYTRDFSRTPELRNMLKGAKT